jgi:Glycosyl transferases group 1
MKIALVHQPLGIQPVPAKMGSIEVLNYELARHFAKSCDVIVYSRKGPDQSPFEIHEGVRYQRMSTDLDDRLLATFERHPKMKRVPGFRDPKRPLFASGLGHLEYSLKVARDLRRQKMLPPHLWRQVSVQDAIPHSDLAQHYRDADIFVLPSVWNEPFALVILEAMSSGLPVIATRGGGFPEAVEDGKTGILVERGDAVGLAEAITRLVENEDLRRSMGQAGRQRALELFTWEKISQDLLQRYGEFMKRDDARNSKWSGQRRESIHESGNLPERENTYSRRRSA